MTTKKEYIARQHGKENHAPLGLTVNKAKLERELKTVLKTSPFASNALREKLLADIKEHHANDAAWLKLNKQIARFETLRLFGLWILAAAAAFVLVVFLCVTFGL